MNRQLSMMQLSANRHVRGAAAMTASVQRAVIVLLHRRAQKARSESLAHPIAVVRVRMGAVTAQRAR